jgi:uncharacterized membrane protein YhaH (DUF805 family)
MGAPSVDPVTVKVSGAARLAMIGTGLLGIFALGSIIPSLAVGIRRLHDTDRSAGGC